MRAQTHRRPSTKSSMSPRHTTASLLPLFWQAWQLGQWRGQKSAYEGTVTGWSVETTELSTNLKSSKRRVHCLNETIKAHMKGWVIIKAKQTQKALQELCSLTFFVSSNRFLHWLSLLHTCAVVNFNINLTQRWWSINQVTEFPEKASTPSFPCAHAQA